MRKTSPVLLVLGVAWLWAEPGRALGQTQSSVARPSDVVAIEAVGEVPGFTPPKLAAYLAEHMQKSAPPPWHFVALSPGAAVPANRVVWRFKVQHVVWPGSNFRDMPQAIHSATYLNAEVKLYLNGAYQATVLRLPTIHEESADADLDEMTVKATKSLFDEGGAASR